MCSEVRLTKDHHSTTHHIANLFASSPWYHSVMPVQSVAGIPQVTCYATVNIRQLRKSIDKSDEC